MAKVSAKEVEAGVSFLDGLESKRFFMYLLSFLGAIAYGYIEFTYKYTLPLQVVNVVGLIAIFAIIGITVTDSLSK